MRNTESQRTRL